MMRHAKPLCHHRHCCDCRDPALNDRNCEAAMVPMARISDRELYSLLMVGLALASVALGVVAVDGIRILCR